MYGPYTNIVPISVPKWINTKTITFNCVDGTESSTIYMGTCSECGKENLIADCCPNCGVRLEVENETSN